MRILFLNLYYRPDVAATAQILSDLAEDLARRGHEVHVWCSPAKYDESAAELPRTEILDGVHVRRTRATRLGKGRLRRRALDYATYLGGVAARLLLGARWDVVVTMTTPPLLEVAGLLAHWRGARFVSWQMDIYPEIAVEERMFAEGGLAARLWRGLSGFALRRADRVVALGESMAHVLAARRSLSPERVAVLPNWTDDEAVRPEPTRANQLRARLGLAPADYVVMYSGNMGRLHPIAPLLAAARALRDEGVHFVFVGHGLRRPEVAAAVESGELPNVHLLPYQPRETLPETLSAADLHAITLKPAVSDLLVPCKLYGILAAGRPTLYLGGEGGEVARVLRASGAGFVVHPDDADGTAAAIRHARDEARRSAELNGRGGAGRAWLDAHNRRCDAIRRWRLLLRDVATGTPP